MNLFHNPVFLTLAICAAIEVAFLLIFHLILDFARLMSRKRRNRED